MACEDLYELRNAMHLGNFSQVISEAGQVRSNQYKKAEENEKLLAEKDYLLAKAQIGMRQYGLAISDLKQSKNPAGKALCCLAEYLRADAAGDSGSKQRAVEEVEGLVKASLEALGEASDANCYLCITAAIVLVHELRFEQALEWLKSWISSLHSKADAKTEKEQGSSGGINALLLELHGTCVDIFLRMNRTDFADSELRHMEKIDDDAPLSNLWHAYICLRKGGDEQLKEAEGLFEDLKEKFGHTNLLLNGTALALMGQGKWGQAEEVLEEALSLRDSDPDTMINLSIAKRQVNPAAGSALIDTVRASHPAHPWTRRIKALEAGFDGAAERAKAF